MWVKFLPRHSEVFKIYTKHRSCLVYNQVYNMFVFTLCPCLSSFPQKTEANYSEIPARSTCHKSRGSAITCRVEIALNNMTHRETRYFIFVLMSIRLENTLMRCAILLQYPIIESASKSVPVQSDLALAASSLIARSRSIN